MRKRITSMITVISLALCGTLGTYPHNANASAKEAFEDISKRSECTKVFDNDNGTYTAYSNTAPIHYLNNDEWKEIDNTLVEDSDGYYKNKSNSFEILLPSEYTIGDKDNYLTIIKTDGFELPTYIKDLNIPEVATEYEKSQININNDEKGSIEELNMPYSMEEALNKATSSAKYQSISNDLDLYISVHNASISESLIANTLEAIPESITYSYPKNEICIERSEDNRILFIKDDEVRYVLSPPTIIDSSDEVNVIEVDYDLIETDEDYELILYPLSNINSPEELLAPLSIGSEYSYERPTTSIYNSQSNPNSVYSTLVSKIGNVNNDNYHTLVSVIDTLAMYGKYSTITDAKYYIYVSNISNTGNYKIKAFSHNTTLSGSSWNNTMPISSNYSLISENDLGSSQDWTGIDVTSLMQSWVNNYNTSSIVGIANNGFTLTLDGGTGATVTANSPRVVTDEPIFEVTFLINHETYKLNYSGKKYNNNDCSSPLGDIYNFQNRMNCYAYALQMYCRNTSTYNQLTPGEIGLSQQIANQQFTDITTFGALNNAYNNWPQYSSSHGNCSLKSFITEQMKKDAQAMGCSVTELSFSTTTTGLNNYINNSFNENNGRLIALAATNVGTQAEIHYYLRNGNGTCNNPNHSSKCSIWTDKFGSEYITGGQNVYCDQFIIQQIQNDYIRFFSCTPVFYYITKDSVIYNSWYYYNHNDNNTGTQFVYNT